MIKTDIVTAFNIRNGETSFCIIIMNTTMEKADSPKIYKHSCIGKSRHVAFEKPAREQKANTVKSKGIATA